MTDPLRTTLQDSLGSAYTLKAELGGGGMSRVFVAREEALGRDVVVKVLAPELAEGLSIERFAREIRLAAALQEPHIVPVLTAGVTSLGMPYYTMPFVRGASLRERMTQGPIAVDESLDLLRDVAHALAYAHAQGIVHRDIKPENILLSSGTAVVTDFGIAKALQLSRTADADGLSRKGITRTGTSLGTPAYMAPEQAAGDPTTDQRADLYAWGLVAYELLAGRHPFATSTSPQQLLTAHMVEVPTALAVDSGVSAEIAALVMRCLAKDPDHRPGSATELLQQLSGVRSSGSRDRDAHDGSVRRATMPSSATPRRTLAGAAVVLLALASVGAWWRSTHRDASDAASAKGPVMMAVLPFEHAGPADQQPFTDGLTDAVTAKLGGLSSLMVIDRRSAATYRGTTKSTQQIGTELGVRYLLEGVVRWAKDGAGVWRARVTPTLVDAKSGAIKWTGEPADVTLDDPFTAQGSIATDVAQAMEVAVLPKERVALKRRFTDDAEAFAAYERAQSIALIAWREHAWTLTVVRRAIHELQIAIARDSSFVEAWGALAANEATIALADISDSAVVNHARGVLAEAQRRGPTDPSILLPAANWAVFVDHDRPRAESLITRALASNRNDAAALSHASGIISLWYPDSARKLALQAARLDPRSVVNLEQAAALSLNLNRPAEARKLANAALAIDSSDERGWELLISIEANAGDSLALQRLSQRVERNIQAPSSRVACNLAFGSTELSRRYLASSASTQRVATLGDSVWYYDCKTDAALRVGGVRFSRPYSDSIISLLAPSKHRAREAMVALQNSLILAYAYANISDTAMALAVTNRNLDEAKRSTAADSSETIYSADRLASIYAAVGDTARAMFWLRRGLRQGVSVRWDAMNPRLRPLHGTESFRRFFRENDK